MLSGALGGKKVDRAWSVASLFQPAYPVSGVPEAVPAEEEGDAETEKDPRGSQQQGEHARKPLYAGIQDGRLDKVWKMYFLAISLKKYSAGGRSLDPFSELQEWDYSISLNNTQG